MGADIRRSSSSARWAWSSCVMEMTPFTATMARIITPSSQSSPPLAARDIAAAASRTRIMGSFSCPSTRSSMEGRSGSASSFGPQRSSLRAKSFISRDAGLLCQSPMVLSSSRLLLSVYGMACPLFWGILVGVEKSTGFVLWAANARPIQKYAAPPG